MSLGLALLGCSAGAADLDQVRATGKLRVLAVDGSPAFLAMRAGQQPGLDREILDGFARLWKLELVVVEAPSWGQLLPWLLEGRGDLIAGGVTVTPARLRQIAFTTEVFPTRNAVLARKPHSVPMTLAQLRRERVGTIRGSSMAEAIVAAGVPAARIDQGLASGGALDALQAGRVTVTVSGIEDAFLFQRQDPAIQIGMFLGPPGSLAFGVPRQAPRLKAALDEYIGNLRRTPTWNRLVLKYFGASAPEILKRARVD